MKNQSRPMTPDEVIEAWLTQTDEQYEKYPPEVIRSSTQMNFFSSRRAAETLIQNYPGVAILTVEETWRLAYENWIVRREKLFNTMRSTL